MRVGPQLFFASLLILGGAACKGCRNEPALTTKDPAVDAGSAPRSPDAAPDASRATKAGAQHPTLSLLTFTDARVAVSSTVDNPKDFPEHLIDGKSETAWNGRTGDLAGGFVAFRVPKEARVHVIRLAVGYDRIAKDGQDLFTANHRIRRVRLSHDGVMVKEITLDVAERKPQLIPVDLPGGSFELTVLETVPGTNKAWRELVVSELEVLGDPGKARRDSPHIPRVRIGSLDGPESRYVDGGAAKSAPQWNRAFPALEAFCKEFERAAAPGALARAKDPSEPCGGPRETSCMGEPEVPITSNAPLVATQIVHTSDGFEDRTSLAIRTTAGVFPDVIHVETKEVCSIGDPGSSMGRILSIHPRATSSGPILLVELELYSVWPMYWDPDTEQPGMFVQVQGTRSLTVCRLAGAVPDCQESHVLGSYSARASAPPPDLADWESPQTYRVEPDGTIALEALDAGAPVP